VDHRPNPNTPRSRDDVLNMQISSKNFIASQALYGRMISHPEWTDEQLVESSYKLAEMMMRRSKSRKPKHDTRCPHTSDVPKAGSPAIHDAGIPDIERWVSNGKSVGHG